jgi:hypothetical protein
VWGGCGGVGGLGGVGCCRVGSLLTFDIPQTALVATLDTYDFNDFYFYFFDLTVAGTRSIRMIFSLIWSSKIGIYPTMAENLSFFSIFIIYFFVRPRPFFGLTVAGVRPQVHPNVRN